MAEAKVVIEWVEIHEGKEIVVDGNKLVQVSIHVKLESDDDARFIPCYMDANLAYMMSMPVSVN